jgi:FAD/FMN-containing dehydrogenase
MPADAPADLVLSTRRLTRILELAPADLVAACEAGVSSAALQEALLARGAWLALDPPGDPARSIGSVIATATAGGLRYGSGPVRDQVLGCTVVTGDGRVIRAGGKVVKNVAGFDLTKLQVGGFGAFGVLTRVQLRLRARPAARVTLLARGERDVLTRQARALAEAGIAAGALELHSPALLDANEWGLVLELAGTPPAVDAERSRALEHSEVSWTVLEPGAAEALARQTATAHLAGSLTVRMGVFADGLDELLDWLAERLDPPLVSAGAAGGGLRWSGSASAEALRALRRHAAEREIPMTLERGPWELRHAVGHFGAYREGVGPLVDGLRASFDPDPTFAVALQGAHE